MAGIGKQAAEQAKRRMSVEQKVGVYARRIKRQSVYEDLTPRHIHATPRHLSTGIIWTGKRVGGRTSGKRTNERKIAT